jgi:hypothetical protein
MTNILNNLLDLLEQGTEKSLASDISQLYDQEQLCKIFHPALFGYNYRHLSNLF